jgi:hypothetical protein
MTRLIDLTGKTFTRWTVIARAENSTAGQTRWLCRCDCGAEGVVQAAALKDSHSQSCGCLKIESTVKRSTKHGHSNTERITPTYHSWAGMLARCNNPKHRSYVRYGGRGIKVCSRWFVFENFLRDMGERPRGLTLERIRNDRNYQPSNCCWASNKEQARNKRTNHMLVIDGVSKTLAEWAEISGIHQMTIRDRISKGWRVERAVSVPATSRGGYGSSKLRDG